MKVEVSGVMRAGKIALDDRPSYEAGIVQFGDGECIVVTIESEEEHHSRAQEKFFYGPVLKAFKPLGYRKQEAKDMLCLMFIPVDVRLPDGTVMRCPGHTSGLKKAEYSDLIEASIQLAAEQGQVIKDAEEWRKQQRKEAA